VNQNDLKLYQDAMSQMVEDVLLDQKDETFLLFELMEYDKFQSMLNQLKEE